MQIYNSHHAVFGSFVFECAMKLLKGLNKCVDVLRVIGDGYIFCVVVSELGDEFDEINSLNVVGVVVRFRKLNHSIVYPIWKGI